MSAQKEKILILAKTYPSPSAQYCETSCIAGITENGAMRRIYPVPFRYLENAQHFSKWQWIEARTRKSKDDHRPESFRIDIETLKCLNTLKTDGSWFERRQWLEKIPEFESFTQLQQWSNESHGSLAILRPKSIHSLEITPARNPDWTPEEREKLARSQNQGSLFDSPGSTHNTKLLEKLPYDFYYHYACDTSDTPQKHKIVDWEAGALYRRCVREKGNDWEKNFRARLENYLPSTDLAFLMGNIHRFQNQWLIISLIYPPKQTKNSEHQSSLF